MGRKHRKRTELTAYIESTTEGRCPYCHKFVKSLEHHKKAKHKKEKLIRRK